MNNLAHIKEIYSESTLMNKVLFFGGVMSIAFIVVASLEYSEIPFEKSLLVDIEVHDKLIQDLEFTTNTYSGVERLHVSNGLYDADLTLTKECPSFNAKYEVSKKIEGDEYPMYKFIRYDLSDADNYLKKDRKQIESCILNYMLEATVELENIKKITTTQKNRDQEIKDSWSNT